MYCSLDLALGEHAAQRGDLFVPDHAQDQALVVILPGGPWDGLYRQELRPFALALAERGIPCAPLGYRPLAEGSRTGEDLVAELVGEVGILLEEAAVAGMDGRSLALLGSGWGSLPALLLASRLVADARLRVRGAIACGATPGAEAADCAPAARATLAAFAGERRPALNPLGLAPETLPPLLLLHGSADEAVPGEVVERFSRRQSEAGETAAIERLAGAGHQFLAPADGPHARAAIAHIATFLASLGGAPAAGDQATADDEACEPRR
jgi:dienelactone hydrolase